MKPNSRSGLEVGLNDAGGVCPIETACRKPDEECVAR